MMLTQQPVAYGASPRVNLLPPAERERRERAELVRRWALAAAVALVVIAVVSGAVLLLERSARSGLDQERARTTTLAEQLAAYQDVSLTARDKALYESFRTQAMANDLVWTSLLETLRGAVPPGAAITGFDVVTTGAPAPAAGSAASGAGGVAGTGVAVPADTAVTATLTVASRRPVDQQVLVSRLQKTPGVLGVDLGGLSSESYPTYTATTVVFLDASVYSQKFAQKSARTAR